MTQKADILIAGAGAAGLISGIALAKSGYNVIVAGPPDTRRNGRTVALFEASLRLLRALDLWPVVEPISSPLAKIRFVDATDSLFRTPNIDLDAREIGLPAFGYNIENAGMVERLAEVARKTPGLTLIEDFVSRYSLREDHIDAELRNGDTITAKLLVGADGKNSMVRKAAGLVPKEWRYPQTAITAILTHEKPHGDVSTEFHTRQGPCTLVPMRDDEQGRHRSSLVWLMSPVVADRRNEMDDDRLIADVERQVGYVYGHMKIASPRGMFPISGLKLQKLSAPRVALVADAGHYFPPIGAQGLNLGLRDVAHLVDCVKGDPGALENMRAYDDSRRGDIALRTLGVDMLNRSLLTDFTGLDILRGVGLMALATLGPLRRKVMREGVVPSGDLPRLMQALGG